MISIKTQFEKIDGCLMQSYDLLYNDLKAAIYGVASCLDVALDEASCNAIFDTINVESVVRKSRISDLKAKIYIFLQSVKRGVMRSGFAGGSLERSRVLVRFSAFMRNHLMYDKSSLMHHNHISSTSGRNGDWVNVYTPQEVEMLQMRYKGWLKQHGYF